MPKIDAPPETLATYVPALPENNIGMILQKAREEDDYIFYMDEEKILKEWLPENGFKYYPGVEEKIINIFREVSVL